MLRNQEFIKGIGNAYTDEILLYAGILPFRKRVSLTEFELERFYKTTRMVMKRYLDVTMRMTLQELASEKRDYLMIHGKQGFPCPFCEGRISEVSANQVKTNYC